MVERKGTSFHLTRPQLDSFERSVLPRLVPNDTPHFICASGTPGQASLSPLPWAWAGWVESRNQLELLLRCL